MEAVHVSRLAQYTSLYGFMPALNFLKKLGHPLTCRFWLEYYEFSNLQCIGGLCTLCFCYWQIACTCCADGKSDKTSDLYGMPTQVHGYTIIEGMLHKNLIRYLFDVFENYNFHKTKRCINDVLCKEISITFAT